MKSAQITSERIVSRLKKNIPGLEAVYLFGSWSRDTQGPNSDIDIIIEVKKKENINHLHRTKLGLPGYVDLFFLNENRLISAHSGFTISDDDIASLFNRIKPLKIWEAGATCMPSRTFKVSDVQNVKLTG